jgi:hypothetical protein
LFRIRRNLATILVAGVTAVLTVGGPSVVAHVGQNAASVDGFSARSFTGNANLRNRLLIATNAAGLLPNNIIRKAPDANLLDGINSTEFLRTTGKAADADKLDNLDSTAFLPVAGKAADSDRLDNIDSTGFASAFDINVSGQFNVPANGSTAGQQDCTPGYRVVGGGVALTDPPGAIVQTTAPYDPSVGSLTSGWLAQVGAGGTAEAFFVWVICARGGSYTGF